MLETPSSQNAAALADWAEILVIAGGHEGVSVTRLGRLLSGEGSDLAEEEFALDLEPEEDSEVELELVDEGRGEREMRIEQLLDEVALRHRLGPRIYPFSHDDVEVTWRETPGQAVYRFLLALSWAQAPARKERTLSQVEHAYDHVALEAMRRYLGRDAKGIRFAKGAHDPSDSNTRPKQFRKAIRWLRKQLGLGSGTQKPPKTKKVPHWEQPDESETGGTHILNTYEDGGVDVVVWWTFADGRPGSPVLLAQCTVQLDWGTKTKDIDVKLWDKWMNFSTTPPQTALVIPFAVNRASQHWHDRTVSAGVVIDRLRLLELLSELGDDVLSSMIDLPTSNWSDTQLAAAT